MTEKELRDEIQKLKSEFAKFGTKNPLSQKNQAERKARCETDVIAFGETYFPHRVRRPSGDPKNPLVTPEHEELIWLCHIKNIPVLCLAYRGFAKSTWGTVIDTLHKIYYKRFQAGVIGSSDAKTAVNNFTSAVFIEIETNPRLLQDFGELSGSYRWGVSDFITRTGIRLAARGMNEMVKGFNNPVNGVRLDLFKGDDLQKRESARSPKQVKALMDWLWEEVYLALREEVDGGSYFNIFGTCVDGGTDAMTQMKDDNEKAMLKLIVPMVLDVPSQSIDTSIIDDVKIKNISEATGQPQWSARYVLEKTDRSDKRVSIHEKKRNAGNAKFSAENQQRPLSATHKVFRVKEWIHYLEPYGEIPVPNWRTHTQIIGRCDPSGTKGGDRKSIVVLSSSPEESRMYVRHVFLQQCSVDELLDELKKIRLLYGCPIGIEENSLKEWLWTDVRYYEEQHQIDLMLFPVHSHLNKMYRIKQLQSPCQRGLFVFQKGHTDQDFLVEETDLYPEGRFDDGLDAWAGVYNELMLLKSAEFEVEQRRMSTGVRRPVQPVKISQVLRGR